MRIIIAMIVVALWASSTDAANYYVSTGGSNSSPGTVAQPFLTIQKAASLASAGDNVYVMEGTYRETVNVWHSGTASEPITFQPYQGANVKITGLDPVSNSWTNTGGSTYVTAAPGGVSQVFVDGQLMLGARWPNAQYNNPLRAVHATIDSTNIQLPPTASTMTDTPLGSAANMAGGKMSVTAGDEYVDYGTTINAHSGNQLSFQWPYTAVSAYTARAGNPYYLYGTLAALDAAKEWYHNSSTGQFYLQASGGTDPNNQSVEVRKRQYGFNLGTQSNINIKGFQLQAASIKIGGNSNTVDNCQILHPRAFEDPTGNFFTIHGGGVEISGQNNTVSNSEIGYSWGDGVTLTGSNNTITNNVIHDVNWLATDCAAVNSYNSGGNHTITNNTMYNSGRSHFTIAGDTPNTQILHNDVSRFGLLTKDLGGIYMTAGNNDGSVIAYNRVYDGGVYANEHVGIYLDNYSSGVTIHNNLVHNTHYGITVNKNPTYQPNNDSVYNNTLWNVSTAMSAWGPDGFVTDNVKTYNNLCNENTWRGTDIQNNRAQTSNQFTDSAAGDYTLTDNSGSSKQAVDYGMTDATHPTDPYNGSEPDAGAFEQGVTPWTAGASWKTWLFTNQTATPLSSAVSVTSFNARTTTGSLLVGNTYGINNRAFLEFDLSEVSDIPIVGAVLRIYEDDVPSSANGDITLYAVSSAWDETNVTFDESVDAGNPISGFYDPANLDLYTDIDITLIVLGWLSDPLSNYGISLRGTEGITGTAKYFDGFFGTTAPQLVITYDAALIPGDADFDRDVDDSDVAILAANWQSASANWSMGDFNGDEKVDDIDATILATNWHVGVRAAAAVPEPATTVSLLALVLAALAGYPGYRRRH